MEDYRYIRVPRRVSGLRGSHNPKPSTALGIMGLKASKAYRSSWRLGWFSLEGLGREATDLAEGIRHRGDIAKSRFRS